MLGVAVPLVQDSRAGSATLPFAPPGDQLMAVEASWRGSTLWPCLRQKKNPPPPWFDLIRVGFTTVLSFSVEKTLASTMISLSHLRELQERRVGDQVRGFSRPTNQQRRGVVLHGVVNRLDAPGPALQTDADDWNLWRQREMRCDFSSEGSSLDVLTRQTFKASASRCCCRTHSPSAMHKHTDEAEQAVAVSWGQFVCRLIRAHRAGGGFVNPTGRSLPNVPLGTPGKQASGVRIEETFSSGRSDPETFAAISSHPKPLPDKAVAIFS